MSADVFEAMEAARRAGRTVVMGTTVRTDGDPPSAPGNRALFAPDGALLAGGVLNQLREREEKGQGPDQEAEA